MSVQTQIPEAIRQKISWNTDVLISRNGTEQRIALRNVPRQEFSVGYLADSDQEVQYWKHELVTRLNDLWNLPLWAEAEKITSAVSIGNTTVNADFSLMDDTFGLSFLILHPDGETYEIFSISGRTATTATRSSGTFTDNFPLGSILVPVEACYVQNNSGYSPLRNNAARLTVDFTGRNNRVLEGKGAAALTYYNSRVVLEDCPLDSQSKQVFSQQLERLDFGGRIQVESTQIYANINDTRSYFSQGKEDRQYWKAFFAAVKGQQKAFYASTFRHDMTVIDQPTVGGYTFTVDDAVQAAGGWENIDSHLQLAIQTEDGATIYREINTATTVDNGDGTHTVGLKNSFPGTVLGSTIKKVSFLELVRLGSDTVEIDHFHTHRVINLPIRTLLELNSFELAPLADFNFTYPAESYDFSSVYATESWNFQSHVAGAYSNSTGTDTLDDNGGTGLLDQIAVGQWNGTNMLSKKAWEARSVNDKCFASLASTGDSNNEDVAGVVVIRQAVGPAHADAWLSKYASAGTGWTLWYAAGQVQILIRDGVNTATVSATLLTGTIGSGCTIYFAFWYDYSANMLYLKSNMFPEASGSTVAVTGSLTNLNRVTVNGWDTAGVGHPYCQYLHADVTVGVNAQARYDEIDTQWKHATDPSGELTTATRNSSITVRVSESRFAHFGPDQLPIGYSKWLSAGYGLFCNSAPTNLTPNSDSFSPWTGGTVTVTANDGDAPDGFRRADKLTATGVAAPKYHNFPAAASTTYTALVWVKRAGGTDVPVTLRLRDLDIGAGSDVTGSFTATAEWKPITIQYTQGAVNVAGGRFYLHIDNNGDAIHAIMACVVAGAWNEEMPGIRTSGVAASLTAPKYEKKGGGGTFILNKSGEIEAVYACTRSVSASGNAYICDAGANAATNNRVAFLLTSNGTRPQSLGTDDAAASRWGLLNSVQDTDGQLSTGIVKWSEDGTLAVAAGAEAQMTYNGVESVHEVGSYAVNNLANTISIGGYRNYASTYAIDGFIGRIRIWSQERV